MDPMYGDDNAAACNNPSPCSGSCAPGTCGRCSVNDNFPNDVMDPNQSRVPLCASWPFKTVTAAVNYIVANTGQTPPLPDPSSVTNIYWERAIIHSLPGLYARSTTVDPDNGLKGNGETFPIHLPPNVSLRGTSARNTVFDLRGPNDEPGWGPAFAFGKIGAHGGPTLLQEFDDWCRGKDTQGSKAYATFPVTYTFDSNQPITAVRFSVEKAVRGIWGSSLADTNLQSFWVVVEKQGQ